MPPRLLWALPTALYGTAIGLSAKAHPQSSQNLVSFLRLRWAVSHWIRAWCSRSPRLSRTTVFLPRCWKILQKSRARQHLWCGTFWDINLLCLKNNRNAHMHTYRRYVYVGFAASALFMLALALPVRADDIPTLRNIRISGPGAQMT